MKRENQQDATIRCLLLTSVSTCFGHHYAHLQENKALLLHLVFIGLILLDVVGSGCGALSCRMRALTYFLPDRAKDLPPLLYISSVACQGTWYIDESSLPESSYSSHSYLKSHNITTMKYYAFFTKLRKNIFCGDLCPAIRSSVRLSNVTN